jgi:hypothetical protein
VHDAFAEVHLVEREAREIGSRGEEGLARAKCLLAALSGRRVGLGLETALEVFR